MCILETERTLTMLWPAWPHQAVPFNGVPVAEPPNFLDFSCLIFLLCDDVKVLQYGGLLNFSLSLS